MFPRRTHISYVIHVQFFLSISNYYFRYLRHSSGTIVDKSEYAEPLRYTKLYRAPATDLFVESMKNDENKFRFHYYGFSLRSAEHFGTMSTTTTSMRKMAAQGDALS